MKLVLAIAFGGALGAVGRHYASTIANGFFSGMIAPLAGAGSGCFGTGLSQVIVKESANRSEYESRNSSKI